ncbi:MAG: hypothetical protein E7447_03190 [Ruminococcaceae bacterium]|nr:hypothetical protein [Oscillospiraceae bacterium]
MNLSEPLLISPLLDGFVMGDPFSNHNGVRTCPAMYLENEKKHIVKIISLPATQAKLEALLLAGAFDDRERALDYFREQADGIIEEAQLLQKLARNGGFIPFDGYQLVPMENDETGFDVYLLSQYRPTLEDVLKCNEMTHLQGVNLGLDLCAALCAARRYGYLYTNLRPSNIFVCNEREFRIGDVGFMRMDSLHYTSLPDKYRSAYTAPEISDAFSALNLTMDTYAMGLILYQVYNDGQLPEANQPMAAPRHADSALAEIILKACSANPEDRWQDPVQMGQALAGYMQTNAVNDTPIAPPPPAAEEPEPEPVVTVEDEEPTTADILAEVDDALDAVAAMMPPVTPTDKTDASTEGVPQEETEDAPEQPEEIPEEDEAAPAEAVQEDVEDMLAQADELIAHQLPDPPVAPEPIDVTLPVEEEEEEPAEEELSEDSETLAPEEQEETEETPSRHRRNRYKGLTVACILVAVSLFLITGFAVFYQHYYLQTVEDMILTGKEDTLTVELVTDIADEKLTVTCTDIYGNSLTSPVKNGIAAFDGLKPDTSYTVEVSIAGMHKLLGEIKESYSTAEATVISGFYATTGLEDGSVILYFSAQGPESPEWMITYQTDDQPAITTAPFTGRQYTLTGLTVGKAYTFTLIPTRELYVTGTNTINYTLSGVVYPENLRAIGFTEQGFGITWNAPAGAAVGKWSIHCYNDAGFDKTVTTEDTAFYFEGLDPASDYTVEVKADGMSLGTRIYISANAITVKDLQVDDSDPLNLKVTWECEGNPPADGWLLMYTIDSITTQQLIACEGNYGMIPLRVPGAHYSISVKPADGSSAFGGQLEYVAPSAEPFSGYLITADNITFSMCVPPAISNWNYEDVQEDDYTTTFLLGQRAAFVAHLDTKTSKVDDQVTTLYVIRDHEGRLICADTEVRTWDDMWNNRYGEFMIPTMPNESGSYSVSVYFDGASVFTQSFSIAANG